MNNTIEGRTVSVLSNMPTKELVEKWRETLKAYYGIDFEPMELIMAFIMDLGYREAMIRFSPYIPKDMKDAPYKESVEHWASSKGGWIDIDNDTELREVLLEKACNLKFGLEYPSYGDSQEYKDYFYKVAGIKNED
jgi:hypothetical protein